MTKIIGTILAIFLTTAVSFAQFKSSHEDEGRLTLWECAVVNVVPPDHDRNPGYKVNLAAEFGDNNNIVSFDVVHTTLDGTTYNRSEQYINGTLVGNRQRIAWSGWRGGNTQMLGTLGAQGGRWMYTEVVHKNNRTETTINTVCHMTGPTHVE
jgi:hypothetical protein